jgi:hypothetical protein
VKWLNNGKGKIVGKLGGISKNKFQWRLLNVNIEDNSCTYCEVCFVVALLVQLTL